MRGSSPLPLARGGGFALGMDHQLAERLRREQAWNVGDLHRIAEAFFGNLGEVTFELGEATLGQYAFLLELRLGHVAARILDDLAARDLDLERPLQPEDHVEKVDR